MSKLEIIADRQAPIAEVARPKISSGDISACIDHNGKFQTIIEYKGERIPVCAAFPSKTGSYCKNGGDLIMNDGHIYMQCKFIVYPYSKRAQRAKYLPVAP